MGMWVGLGRGMEGRRAEPWVEVGRGGQNDGGMDGCRIPSLEPRHRTDVVFFFPARPPIADSD